MVAGGRRLEDAAVEYGDVGGEMRRSQSLWRDYEELKVLGYTLICAPKYL